MDIVLELQKKIEEQNRELQKKDEKILGMEELIKKKDEEIRYLKNSVKNS